MQGNMITGAVAILDALGFKGIWQRYGPADVIAKMKAVEAMVPSEPFSMTGEFVCGAVPQVTSRVRFMSDTIVLALSVAADRAVDPKIERALQMTAIGELSNLIRRVLLAMLLHGGDPPLAHRGAMSWGEFLIDGNFMVGPAIDEAAAHEGLADAAIVWFAPSALALLEDLEDHRHDVVSGASSSLYTAPITPWDVPMNAGGARRTRAIALGTNVDELVDATRRAFRMDESQPPLVQGKFASTETFLRNQRRDVTITGRGFFDSWERRAAG